MQCDFNLPQRFEMDYISAEGTKEQPIMLHRAIFGSIERFFGVSCAPPMAAAEDVVCDSATE